MRWRTIHRALVMAGLWVLIFSAAAPCAAGFVDRLNDELKRRFELGLFSGAPSCRGELICGSSLIPDFYRGRDFKALWIDANGITQDAAILISTLQAAAGEGLQSRDYHLADIQAQMPQLEAIGKNGAGAQISRWADLEILFSDAFFLFSSHLLGGRVNPETLHPDWVITGDSKKLLKTLKTALAPGNMNSVFERLRPPHAGYSRLKGLLQTYRTMATSGGWPVLAAGPSLHKGDVDTRCARLRKRLSISGDLSAASGLTDADLYDAPLEKAVRRFQKRHGLSSDGVVGKNTLFALNTRVEDRIRQIELNLERWRWLPRDLGDRYIWINTADFKLSVIEKEQNRMEMRVVVGKPARKTPVFSSTLSSFIINPFWTVPKTIALEDILPKVKRDPAYLSKHQMRVFEGWAANAPEISPAAVNWRVLNKDYFPFQLRQDPGELNSLGKIKFMFPNKFDVYLHDTPNRNLFSEPVRGFSSGCIRIEKPIDLAEYLTSGSEQWTREALVRTIDSAVRTVVRLARPIRIHILYMTAWVDEDGAANFRRDIYRRDDELQQALNRRFLGEPAATSISSAPDAGQRR